MDAPPRELTTEEVRDRFLRHVWDLVNYWQHQDADLRGKLSGLAFSMLSAIDGSTGDLPGFILAPHPHSEDREYHQEQGEDWYPENHRLDSEIKADIGGSLHEAFCQMDPTKGG